MKLSVNILFV